MSNFTNALGDVRVEPSGDADIVDRKAREAALRAVDSVPIQSTSLIDFRSLGRVLIVGPLRRALSAAEVLREMLDVCVLATNHDDDSAQTGFVTLYSEGRPVHLSGRLGEFTATLLMDGGEANVAHVLDPAREHFDLVLDLGDDPLLDFNVPPFGYFAPRGDEKSLAQALSELPELVGDFEKAKYFHYNPDLCVHGRSGLPGCRRCLDACPTGAITSLVERIAVDPYYCQGGGSCATACPTGAIIYSYPRPADAVNRLRVLLRTYRAQGGIEPVLLFHDAGAGQAHLERLADRLPARVIPVTVEEIGSVGMDIWFSALAFGAARVLLLDTEQVPERARRALDEQLQVAHSLLGALGYSTAALSMVVVADNDEQQLLTLFEARDFMPALEPAGFAGSNEKRRAIFQALDYLSAQAPQACEITQLPQTAAFGEIRIDQASCTLCMACVSVCPASALSDGVDTPRLDFLEINCVQCGLCESACPENVITLNPRFVFDPETRRQRRVLNEEEPFLCASCGTPFATRSMIQRMQVKLQGHRMFQDPAALRRLEMCGDCRVRDLYSDAQNIAEL